MAAWAKMPRWFVLCRRRRRARAGSGGLSVGTDCNAGLCRVYRMSALSAGHVLTHKKGGGSINPDQSGSTPPPPFKETVGSALLSHDLPAAVPSAQKGLTSRFGKDTGCNPLAKTTNTTNKQHPKRRNPPVSETIIHLTTQPTNPKGFVTVLVVNRTVDANTIKHTNQKQAG